MVKPIKMLIQPNIFLSLLLTWFYKKLFSISTIINKSSLTLSFSTYSLIILFYECSLQWVMSIINQIIIWKVLACVRERCASGSDAPMMIPWESRVRCRMWVPASKILYVGYSWDNEKAPLKVLPLKIEGRSRW